MASIALKSGGGKIDVPAAVRAGSIVNESRV
jgi:hypothetical protein